MATAADAEAIDADAACAAGRSPTATSSRRRSSTQGGFVQLERWRARLADPRLAGRSFVAERDGAVVGFASVGPSRDERGIGELYAIYVDPDAWSTGRRPRADRARARSSSRRLRRGDALGARGQPARRGVLRARRLAPDGARKAEERWGVRAPEVRYRKRAQELAVAVVAEQLARFVGVTQRSSSHLVLRAAARRRTSIRNQRTSFSPSRIG